MLAVGLPPGCGRSDQGESGQALPTTSTVPALLADLVLDVEGAPSTDLCFSGSSESLDLSFRERCYEPPYALPIMYVGGGPAAVGDPDLDSASLLVSPFPVVVTEVSQPGVDVVWRQVGQGLVVLGLSMLAAETEIRFTVDGRVGRCSFSPDKESCRVG